MTRSRAVRGVAILALVLVLAACAAGPNDAVPPPGTDVAGFWMGLWQGAISPITFIISLFSSDVSVYEVYNNGNWYDAGFMFGVSIAFSGAAGSGAAGRSRARSRR